AVPGDFSAAAFWLVAGGLVETSDIRLLAVGVNPTRTAFAGLLTSLGFRVGRARPRLEAGEAVVDLEVTPAGDLHPVRVEAGMAEIEDAECVEISYPNFFDHLEYLC